MNLSISLLEQAYDAEQSGDLIRAVELRARYHSERQQQLDQAAPAAPAIQVEHWQSEGGAIHTDLTIGDGLTKVLIGGYGPDPDKRGIELIIGGTCINDRLDEIVTLDDMRQLRDNLTALLNDPRIAA